MATLLVTLCIKHDKKDLIPLAVLFGFGLDFLIAFFISNLIKIS